MQNYLLFLNLKVADNVKDKFDEQFGSTNYVCYDEVSASGKEHIHVCLDSHYKRDTIQKWIIKTYPQLKRDGHGGEHKYKIKLFPEQYKPAHYDEYPQDYITKDNNYRCGELWSNVNQSDFHSKSADKPLEDLIEEKLQRYYRVRTICEKTTELPKEKKATRDERLKAHLEKILEQNQHFFYKKNMQDLDRKLLIKEIKKFYIVNGRQGNRKIFTEIAEAVIWYGEIVCPEDEDTCNDVNLAIENEIDKLLSPSRF